MSISRYLRKNLKSKILAYSDFAYVSELCTIMCITNVPWIFMLKILSDPISIATLLQDFLFFVCLSVFYKFATKSIQNNQNRTFSADPPQKIWE